MGNSSLASEEPQRSVAGCDGNTRIEPEAPLQDEANEAEGSYCGGIEALGRLRQLLGTGLDDAEEPCGIFKGVGPHQGDAAQRP